MALDSTLVFVASSRTSHFTVMELCPCERMRFWHARIVRKIRPNFLKGHKTIVLYQKILIPRSFSSSQANFKQKWRCRDQKNKTGNMALIRQANLVRRSELIVFWLLAVKTWRVVLPLEEQLPFVKSTLRWLNARTIELLWSLRYDCVLNSILFAIC